MYTKIQFGIQLKDRLLIKQDVGKIGSWAYEVFIDHADENDVEFLKLLLILNKMELGPEFAFSYEMLAKIADDLISGKEVYLNSDEYREAE